MLVAAAFIIIFLAWKIVILVYNYKLIVCLYLWGRNFKDIIPSRDTSTRGTTRAIQGGAIGNNSEV